MEHSHQTTEPAMGVVHPGARNPNWKGGRTIASNGYALVRMPEHQMADVRGYVYEHRIVASESLGRALRPGEQVHHINGDKLDNRPENLEVCDSLDAHRFKHRSQSSRLRIPGEANEIVSCACGCGETFQRFDALRRPRMFVSGHNLRKEPS